MILYEFILEIYKEVINCEYWHTEGTGKLKEKKILYVLSRQL